MSRQSVIVGMGLVALVGLTIGCDAFSDKNTEFDALNSAGVYNEDNGGGAGPGGSGGSGSAGPAAPAPKAAACTAVANVKVTASEKPSITANSGWGAKGKATAAPAGDQTAKVNIAGEGGTVSITLQKTGDKEYTACSVSYVEATPTPAAPSAPASPVPAPVKADAPTAPAPAPAPAPSDATTGREYEVVSGTIVVDQFSAGPAAEAAKADAAGAAPTINAGSYQITVKPKGAEGAAKAVKMLLGAALPVPPSAPTTPPAPAPQPPTLVTPPAAPGTTPAAEGSADGSIKLEGTYFVETLQELQTK